MAKPRPELAPFFALDPRPRICTGGSEGSQFREYKLPPAVYFPVGSPVALRQPPQHRPRVDPALWPEVAERAGRESLRARASEYGVSHETIRTIVRRMAANQPAAPAACARPNHTGAQQPGAAAASASASSTATWLWPGSLAG